jgi:hypothetical protein
MDRFSRFHSNNGCRVGDIVRLGGYTTEYVAWKDVDLRLRRVYQLLRKDERC